MTLLFFVWAFGVMAGVAGLLLFFELKFLRAKDEEKTEFL